MSLIYEKQPKIKSFKNAVKFVITRTKIERQIKTLIIACSRNMNRLIKIKLYFKIMNIIMANFKYLARDDEFIKTVKRKLIEFSTEIKTYDIYHILALRFPYMCSFCSNRLSYRYYTICKVCMTKRYTQEKVVKSELMRHTTCNNTVNTIFEYLWYPAYYN
jgi:hypothetical protein